MFYPPFYTSRTKYFSFKSECVVSGGEELKSKLVHGVALLIMA